MESSEKFRSEKKVVRTRIKQVYNSHCLRAKCTKLVCSVSDAMRGAIRRVTEVRHVCVPIGQQLGDTSHEGAVPKVPDAALPPPITILRQQKKVQWIFNINNRLVVLIITSYIQARDPWHATRLGATFKQKMNSCSRYSRYRMDAKLNKGRYKRECLFVHCSIWLQFWYDFS